MPEQSQDNQLVDWPPPGPSGPDRWFIVLVVTPLSLLFFGGGGAWVIGDEFGFGNPAVQTGIVAATAVNLLLLVIGLLRRPLTGDELRRSRTAYRQVTGRNAVFTFAGIGTVLALLISLFVSPPFFISFIFALMTGASVVAAVLALARKGLHQPGGDTTGKGHAVWTHLQINRGTKDGPPTGTDTARRTDNKRNTLE